MNDMPRLLVSDISGNISIHGRLAAAGMKAGRFFRLDAKELVKLPAGSRLFMLPSRAPAGYDPSSKKFVRAPGYFAVAAFIRPGFTATFSPSFYRAKSAKPLPLFSYASCVFYKGALYTTAVEVDKDKRHDQRFIDLDLVKEQAQRFRRTFGSNRLIRHLEGCALTYGCPNAQNFFLHRYEAPLPVSPSCNAECAGCISYQPKKRNACASQPRIKFVPTPDEISEIALYHIDNVKDPIVSFGQGCEGEPLLKWAVIEKAIRLIRKSTGKGVININTNGSLTAGLARCLDSGLDSVRVSLNSARAAYYTRYYKPAGYAFKDVLRSIALVKMRNRFASLNYLTMPGFTDSKDEFAALAMLIEELKPDMIQWRNLNYDPMLYFAQMKTRPAVSEMLGVGQEMGVLKKMFPYLKMGYFNPGRAILRAAVSPRL